MGRVSGDSTEGRRRTGGAKVRLLLGLDLGRAPEHVETLWRGGGQSVGVCVSWNGGRRTVAGEDVGGVVTTLGLVGDEPEAGLDVDKGAVWAANVSLMIDEGALDAT